MAIDQAMEIDISRQSAECTLENSLKLFSSKSIKNCVIKPTDILLEIWLKYLTFFQCES